LYESNDGLSKRRKSSVTSVNDISDSDSDKSSNSYDSDDSDDNNDSDDDENSNETELIDIEPQSSSEILSVDESVEKDSGQKTSDSLEYIETVVLNESKEKNDEEVSMSSEQNDENEIKNASSATESIIKDLKSVEKDNEIDEYPDEKTKILAQKMKDYYLDEFEKQTKFEETFDVTISNMTKFEEIDFIINPDTFSELLKDIENQKIIPDFKIIDGKVTKMAST